MKERLLIETVGTPSRDFNVWKWEILRDKLMPNKDTGSELADMQFRKMQEIGNVYDRLGKPFIAPEIPKKEGIMRLVHSSASAAEYRGAGSKFTADTVMGGFLKQMEVELRGVLKPYNMRMHCSGGTEYNKAYYLKNILGNGTEVKFFGRVGNDTEGQKIKEDMELAGINFVDDGQNIPVTRRNFIFTIKGETDRTIAKYPYTAPDYFSDPVKTVSKLSEGGVFLLESSLIKFMGVDGFKEFVTQLKEKGKAIAFAPPTDKSFYWDHKENRLIKANFSAFKFAAMNSAVITMNETEAMEFYTKGKFNGEVDGLDDKNLNKVLKLVSRSMRGEKDRLVLITAGSAGMIAVGKDHKGQDILVKIQGMKVDKEDIVNTVGAGDSAAAAFIATIFEGGNQQPVTDRLVKQALRNATKLSTEVIKHNTAQIAPEFISKALGGRER